MSIIQNLKEEGGHKVRNFCKSTSLHGYNFLINVNSFFWKLFWFIVILLFTSLGIGLLVTNTFDYFNRTVVTTIDSSSADLEVSMSERNSKFMFMKIKI